MAAFDTTRTSYGSHGLFGRITATITAASAALIDWNDARVTKKSLSKLSDRELADLGLSRADIDRVADGQPVF